MCGSTSSGAFNSSHPLCFHNHTGNVTGDPEYQVGASVQPKDLGHVVLFSIALMTAVYLFYVLVFPPRYRRVEAEKRVSFMYIARGTWGEELMALLLPPLFSFVVHELELHIYRSHQ